MKHLLENFQRKWPTYFFEILVLIIGIYSAFVLERWNEARKDNKQKNVYLAHILANLQDDKKQLDSLLNHTINIIERTDQLINSFKTQFLDAELATQSAGVLAIEKNFNGYRSGMDALLSSGQLDIIPDNISLELQQYYEKSEDVVQRESMSNEYIREFYEPHVFENYSDVFVRMEVFDIMEMYKDDTRIVKSINRKKFLNDRQLEIHIVIRNIQSKVELDMYEQLIAINADLQDQIKILLPK